MLSKMRLRYAVSAIAIMVGLATGVAHAQESKTSINVAITSYFPPFVSKDSKTNKLVGFDIDLIEAMGAKMGAKIVWNESSFAELISSVVTKRVDLALTATDKPERRAAVSFVDYWRDAVVFYTLRTNAGSYANSDSLCGKRVAATRSSTWPIAVAQWSDQHCVRSGKPPMIVVATETSPDAALQLTQGRVDASVLSAASLIYQNASQDNRFAIIGQPFFSQLQGMMFAKDDTRFGEAVRKTVSALMADGTYQKLMRKWNIPEYNAVQQATINAGS